MQQHLQHLVAIALGILAEHVAVLDGGGQHFGDLADQAVVDLVEGDRHAAVERVTLQQVVAGHEDVGLERHTGPPAQVDERHVIAGNAARAGVEEQLDRRLAALRIPERVVEAADLRLRIGTARRVLVELRHVHLREAAIRVVLGEPPLPVLLADRARRQAAAAVAVVGLVDGDPEAVARQHPSGGQSGHARTDDGDGPSVADVGRQARYCRVRAPRAERRKHGRPGQCGEPLQQEAA